MSGTSRRFGVVALRPLSASRQHFLHFPPLLQGHESFLVFSRRWLAFFFFIRSATFKAARVSRMIFGKVDPDGFWRNSIISQMSLPVQSSGGQFRAAEASSICFANLTGRSNLTSCMGTERSRLCGGSNLANDLAGGGQR